MIITCEKCSTKFNLDDSLVKDSGSKVRCSLCKHIFTAYPTPQEEPSLAPGVIPEMIPDTEDSFDSPDLFDTDSSDTDSSDADLFDSDVDDFSIQEDDLTIESQSLEIEDVGLEIEDSSLEIQDTSLELESSGLEIETSGLEMEDDESDDGVADFEMEDDFSFEEDDFEIKSDDKEVAGLEMETSDEDTGIEVDDQMEFYAEPEENPDEAPDNDSDDYSIDETGDEEADFDGIEFEALEDESEDDYKLEIDTQFNADESSLVLETQEDDEAPNEDIIEEEFELEFDTDEDVEEDQTGSMDDISDAIKTESVEQKDSENEPLMITPEDDFSEYDKVLGQETEPDDDLLDEETIDVDDAPEEKQDTLAAKKELGKKTGPPTHRIKKKKPLVGTPVLILVLIFFLVASAYVASIMTGYKIPYLSDIQIPAIEKLLKKAPDKTSEVTPVPNQKSVNGRFVTNSNAGTIFVITGTVENPSKIAFSHIEIKGSLFTKGNVEVKTKNAFCGNIITEEMLKTGTIADIDKILITKEGNHNTNVKIKPGASIPFMVVFSELPEKLQNFIVKVNSFEKAQ